MHNRLHPQRWKTSNGIFETSKIGNVLLTLPKFSTSKIMSVRPNIQFIDEGQPRSYKTWGMTPAFPPQLAVVGNG
jgi:hypothetical protein